MSRGFFDNNKDTNDEALTERCQTLIARLERKLDFKRSLVDQEERYLIR